MAVHRASVRTACAGLNNRWRLLPQTNFPESLFYRDFPAFSTSTKTRVNKHSLTPLPPRTQELYNGLVAGDRYALAKAITLVESSRADHRADSRALLACILEKSRRDMEAGEKKKTFRIGLSGSPGVGKSTFIEALGMFVINKGHKLAVLAVDPSSARTGGSILGDKTRMDELSKAENAYVRPSPNRGTLGGVARGTNEAVILCEASGYDVCMIETVGVGQSETMVADMVDIFVLLVPPAGGDELQGMKKGIVEMSDLVIVNKADGILAPAAKVAQMEYMSALKFLQPRSPSWRPKVIRVSSVEKEGIDKAWETMQLFHDALLEGNELEHRRGEQRKRWMWNQITNELLYRLNDSKKLRDMVPLLEEKVYRHEITSSSAAEEVLSQFLK